MGPLESGAIEGLVVSSAGVSESSPLVDISGGLLGKIGEGILADTVIVKWSVTGCVDCTISPPPLPRTKGISARGTFS